MRLWLSLVLALSLVVGFLTAMLSYRRLQPGLRKRYVIAPYSGVAGQWTSSGNIPTTTAYRHHHHDTTATATAAAPTATTTTTTTVAAAAAAATPTAATTAATTSPAAVTTAANTTTTTTTTTTATTVATIVTAASAGAATATPGATITTAVGPTDTTAAGATAANVTTTITATTATTTTTITVITTITTTIAAGATAATAIAIAANVTHTTANPAAATAVSVTPHRSGALLWFLHFHKAGGSSFTSLAGLNGERKRRHRTDPRGSDDPHSHLELDQGRTAKGQVLRWSLIVSSASIAGPSTLCKQLLRRSAPGAVPAKKTGLSEGLKSLTARHITFVSTEHWFPLLSPAAPPNAVLLTILREPIARVVSSYGFHRCSDGRCPGGRSKRCSFPVWRRAERNLYTRMLNGVPFAPSLMPEGCTRDYAAVKLGEREYAAAAQSLRSFHLVLTLDLLSERAAQCALARVTGWRKLAMPHTNAKLGGAPWGGPCQKPTPKETDDARSDNQWDIKLYELAKQLQAGAVERFGCQ